MTEGKDPFAAFGRGERTIIRPKPVRPSAGPGAPFSSPVPQAAPTSATPDDYSVGEALRTPRPSGEAPLYVRTATGEARREDLLTPNDNPLLRAAAPVLVLLARLRVSMARAPLGELREQVAEAVNDFEQEVRAAGVSPEQARVAKYILAATADDIVQNLPSDERHVWTQHSMLSRFFGEALGGVRFFEELDRAKADPTHSVWQLELQHACLAIGFQGVQRSAPGGQAILQQLQRNIYEVLRSVKKPKTELAPRWRGQIIPVSKARATVPLWAAGGVTSIVLLGSYLAFRLLLSGEADAAAATLIGLHPTGEIGIQRRIFKPPPPPPPTPLITRLRAALGPPLTVEESGGAIVVRLGNINLFDGGSATLRDEYKPLISKVAAVIDKEPGKVRVLGHTDNIPIRTIRFASNHQLSLERAQTVAALMRGSLAQPDRVESEGKGADAPIASNATPQGRALNRRVEIVLQRSAGAPVISQRAIPR